MKTHNWQTEYDSTNEAMQKKSEEAPQLRTEIPSWFKPRYHKSNNGYFTSNYSDYMGVFGDNPYEKLNFDQQVEGKLVNDTYEIGKGTAKSSNKLIGYQGFIPVNEIEREDKSKEDAFKKFGNTNHLFNHKVRVPGYSGFIPKHPQNLKGQVRPFCLSTEGERFN